MVLVMALPTVLYNHTRFKAASDIICEFAPDLKSDVTTIAPPKFI